MNTNRPHVHFFNKNWTYGKAKLNWYNKEVNELIFEQPYCRPQKLATLLKVKSRTTITNYMKQLVKLGILSPIEDSRYVYYANNDLVRILER